MKKITVLLLVICMLASTILLASCAAMNDSLPSYDGHSKGEASTGSGSLGGDGSFSDKAPEMPDGGYGDFDTESGTDMVLPPVSEDWVEGDKVEGDVDVGGDVDGGDGNGNVYLPAGMITAGAWNDNDYYQMWRDLFVQGEANGKFFDFTMPNNSWGFDSLNRIKVTVNDGENPVAGAKVVASDESGNKVFSAVTDAQGNAYLFTSVENGKITVTSGEGSADLEFTKDSRELVATLDKFEEKRDVIEIMFVVDVTGSMGDEISFLKAELADVINKIASNNSGADIRLALLFYRDTYDSVPFDYYDFTDVTTPSGLEKQQQALNKQYASGGGDYPEAVDEALEMAVNQQWSTGATTKLIFQVLDAPAHDGAKYKEKLNTATKTAAEKGIRICPIICSGSALVAEYTMREAAIYTGGTFIYVTDDSGIGGSHHDPGLPNATVELLNSMLVRLVNGYHTGKFATPIYWKEDPGLNIRN